MGKDCLISIGYAIIADLSKVSPLPCGTRWFPASRARCVAKKSLKTVEIRDPGAVVVAESCRTRKAVP